MLTCITVEILDFNNLKVVKIEMHFSYENLTGTLVNYFGHCKRQTWLFARGFRMESESDLVRKGKWIDENTFLRNAEVNFVNQNIKTDFVVRKEGYVEIHEVKSSKIPKNEHKLQLAFYLLKLEQAGIRSTGILNYPETRETIKVTLEDIRVELMETIGNIISVLNSNCPKRLERTKCKGCAYYELCYSNQEVA